MVKLFIKYFFVALTSLAVDMGLYILLIKYAQMHYFWASFISFSFGFCTNFTIGKLFIFKNGSKFNCIKKEFLSVLAVSIIGLMLHQSALAAFIEVAKLNQIIAKLFATGISFFWNFTARSKIIYTSTGRIESTT